MSEGEISRVRHCLEAVLLVSEELQDLGNRGITDQEIVRLDEHGDELRLFAALLRVMPWKRTQEQVKFSSDELSKLDGACFDNEITPSALLDYCAAAQPSKHLRTIWSQLATSGRAGAFVSSTLWMSMKSGDAPQEKTQDAPQEPPTPA